MEEHENGLNTSSAAASSSERCPSCGQDNPLGSEQCAACGQRLQPRLVSEVGNLGGAQLDHPSRFGNGETPLAQPDSMADEEVNAGARPEAKDGLASETTGKDAQRMDEYGLRYSFPSAYSGLILQPAGVLRRAAALAADWILVSLLAMLVLHVGGMGAQLHELSQLMYSSQGFGALTNSALSPELKSMLSLIVAIELGLAVGMYIIFAVFGGSTPGMWMVGIQMCRIDGADITLKTAVLRAVLLWAFIYFTAGFYLLVAGLYVLIDPKGRSVHDLMSGTNVFLR